MRMVAKRLHEGEDLKLAIEQWVRAERLSAATVMSGVGSLRPARMRMAGAQPDKQDIREYDGELEIVSLIGNLGQGRTHLHIAVSDKEGNVTGGHLKEGSIVHTTAEIVLAVDDNLTYSEETDAATGFGELKIEEKG
jgi:predicted DNA-binding protein with PD1-like motif